VQRHVWAFKYLHSKCTERLICCRYPALRSALTAWHPAVNPRSIKRAERLVRFHNTPFKPALTAEHAGNSRQSIQSDPGQFAQQPHASPSLHRIFYVGRQPFLPLSDCNECREKLLLGPWEVLPVLRVLRPWGYFRMIPLSLHLAFCGGNCDYSVLAFLGLCYR
jgi:hypothetical protein